MSGSRASGASGAPRAAVDIGSNSVRLLVVDGRGQRIVRELAITRLAAGVDRSGHLDDEAVERTVRTIGRFRDVWRAHGVDGGQVRIAATSAVRDAQDRDRFLDAVERETGVRPEVLSGEQEAAFAFAGASAAVEVPSPAAVLDIGGGSTELIVGAAPDDAAAPGGAAVAGSVSLQLGCVRLTERCLSDDPPTAAQREAAGQVITEQLDHADEILAAQGVAVADAAALIAVAGTATTLGALHLGLDDYVEERIHGVRIPAASVCELAESLAELTAAQRARLGPMQPGREDVIHGGALVLDAVLRRYGFREVVVSEADGLNGLARAAGRDGVDGVR